MEEAGFPRSVAMKISGHKAESIYSRYAIVAERDVADTGLRKVDAFFALVDPGASPRGWSSQRTCARRTRVGARRDT